MKRSSVGGEALAADYALAVTVREGKTVGFTESAGRGRTASGDAARAGVSLKVEGSSPQGEEGTMATCRRLVQALNATGQHWREPVERNEKDVDAIATGRNGAALKIQVVRAVTDRDFWQSLDRDGAAAIVLPVAEAALLLKQAVEHKTGKIDAVTRQTLTLALDATDVPGLALDVVVDVFNADHGDWISAQGFAGVWVVGPTPKLVHQLHRLA